MTVMLTRRTSLLALLSGFVGQSAARPAHAQAAFKPTAQDQADLARIETYLNGLRALKAKFLQVAPDGGLSHATLCSAERLCFEPV